MMRAGPEVVIREVTPKTCPTVAEEVLVIHGPPLDPPFILQFIAMSPPVP